MNGAETAGFEYPDIPVMRELGTELFSVIAGIAGIEWVANPLHLNLGDDLTLVGEIDARVVDNDVHFIRKAITRSVDVGLGVEVQDLGEPLELTAAKFFSLQNSFLRHRLGMDLPGTRK